MKCVVRSSHFILENSTVPNCHYIMVLQSGKPECLSDYLHAITLWKWVILVLQKNLIICLHRLFYVSKLSLFKASALIHTGSFFSCPKFNSLAALCKVSNSLPLASWGSQLTIASIIVYYASFHIFKIILLCVLRPVIIYLSIYDNFFSFREYPSFLCEISSTTSLAC